MMICLTVGARIGFNSSSPPPQLSLSLQLSIDSNRSFALSSHCCKSSIHVSISGLLALVKLCFALSYGIVPFSYLCVRYLSSTVPTHPYSSSFLSYSISVCLGNMDPNTLKCKSGSWIRISPQSEPDPGGKISAGKRKKCDTNFTWKIFDVVFRYQSIHFEKIWNLKRSF